MELYDVVKKLIGDTTPVGDSWVDQKRLENLKEMIILTRHLLEELTYLEAFSDNFQYGVRLIGEHAKHALIEFKEHTNIDE